MGANTTSTAGTNAGTFNSNQLTSNQVTKDPYAAALPYMTGLANNAQALYSTYPTQQAVTNLGGYTTPYQTGQQYLQNSPNGITSQMQTPLSQLGDVSSGANNITTADQYQQLFNQQQAQAGSSTGLSDTQNAILDQNAQRIANQQASLYSGAGRYGSFGAGIGAARGIAETNNPLMAQFQQANVGNSLAALGGLSNVQQQNIGNQMNAANSQLGQYNQGIQNQQRQEALQPGSMNLALAPQNAVWQDLNNFSGALSSMYPMFANNGTITTNGNVNTSGFQNTNTTGSTSQPTPWTTYAGLGLAGVGAGSSLFSDRRLKTDIKKVGKDPWTNLNMYQWRYKGAPKSTPLMVGPMAQEVQEKFPEAVGETPGGILYIKKAA